MPTQTFWLDATDDVVVGLRRYVRTGSGESTCPGGYHSALVYTGVESATWDETDHGRILAARPHVPHDDPRWPVECARGCGYQFTDDDHWQEWQELLYRRADTGELVTLHPGHGAEQIPGAPTPAPPGAMWDAWWMADHPSWTGPDGVALMVRLPDGHDWHVDGEAANCTRKGDLAHKCWVRTGDPRTANVTAGKDGETCAAGAGSIASHGYHGFLRAGVLT